MICIVFEPAIIGERIKKKSYPIHIVRKIYRLEITNVALISTQAFEETANHTLKKYYISYNQQFYCYQQNIWDTTPALSF